MTSGPEKHLELVISDVAYGGKGIGRHEGLVVFVPDVLTGETVRVAMARRHKRFAEGRLLEVLDASPHRITPSCPLTDAGRSPTTRCAGCCYQHVDYGAELNLKSKQLADLLRRIGKIGDPSCGPAVASPQATGYRNKIVLHVAKKTGSPLVGYVAVDNRTIIDIECCPLARPELNTLLKDLRKAWPDNMRPGQSLTLRHTTRNGALYWLDRPTDQERLTEQSSLGEMDVPRNCFFQVNPPLADLLLDEVSRIVNEVQPEMVIDLYCGVGLFAIAAARAGAPTVCGIDTNTRSIRAARRNSRAQKLDIPFFAGTASTALRELTPRPDPAETMVLVDPPRKGLDPATIERLTELRPAHIVYVSCAADTLARDVARLAGAGYKLSQSRVFDMFPRTALFESLSILRLP